MSSCETKTKCNFLHDRTKDNTSSSVEFSLKDCSDLPIDLTDATAIGVITRDVDGLVVKEVSLSSGLTISTPTNGIIVLDKFFCDFEVGIYSLKITFTLANTDIKSYIKRKFKVIL